MANKPKFPIWVACPGRLRPAHQVDKILIPIFLFDEQSPVHNEHKPANLSAIFGIAAPSRRVNNKRITLYFSHSPAFSPTPLGLSICCLARSNAAALICSVIRSLSPTLHAASLLSHLLTLSNEERYPSFVLVTSLYSWKGCTVQSD